MPVCAASLVNICLVLIGEKSKLVETDELDKCIFVPNIEFLSKMSNLLGTN